MWAGRDEPLCGQGGGYLLHAAARGVRGHAAGDDDDDDYDDDNDDDDDDDVDQRAQLRRQVPPPHPHRRAEQHLVSVELCK